MTGGCEGQRRIAPRSIRPAAALVPRGAICGSVGRNDAQEMTRFATSRALGCSCRRLRLRGAAGKW